jgi:hypothetical protein
MIAPCSPVLTAFAAPFLTALVVFLVVSAIMYMLCLVLVAKTFFGLGELFRCEHVFRTW